MFIHLSLTWINAHMINKSHKKIIKYLHAGVFLIVGGCFSSLSNGEKGCPACFFKRRYSFLCVWSFSLLILSGIIIFQLFFFHSSILLLAFHLALKKDPEPSLIGIHKCDLHFILHYLTLELIKRSKQPSSQASFSYMRHRYFLFQYHKNFRLVRRLKGSALCLLQTQYAKKPKNPV